VAAALPGRRCGRAGNAAQKRCAPRSEDLARAERDACRGPSGTHHGPRRVPDLPDARPNAPSAAGLTRRRRGWRQTSEARVRWGNDGGLRRPAPGAREHAEGGCRSTRWSSGTGGQAARQSGGPTSGSRPAATRGVAAPFAQVSQGRRWSTRRTWGGAGGSWSHPYAFTPHATKRHRSGPDVRASTRRATRAWFPPPHDSGNGGFSRPIRAPGTTPRCGVMAAAEQQVIGKLPRQTAVRDMNAYQQPAELTNLSVAGQGQRNTSATKPRHGKRPSRLRMLRGIKFWRFPVPIRCAPKWVHGNRSGRAWADTTNNDVLNQRTIGSRTTKRGG